MSFTISEETADDIVSFTFSYRFRDEGGRSIFVRELRAALAIAAIATLLAVCGSSCLS